MTCNDLRRITSAPLRDSTRAERVAITRHLMACPECKAWFDKGRPLHPMPRSETDRLIAETIADKEAMS